MRARIQELVMTILTDLMRVSGVIRDARSLGMLEEALKRPSKVRQYYLQLQAKDKF
jgi:hypothetical protein